MKTAAFDHLLGLDFDGVLSPGNSATLRYSDALDKLLSSAYPRVKILLTTNWRQTHAHDELLEWLPTGLASRVVGATPIHPDGERHGGRQREIEAWLRQHTVRSFLAVDDRAELYKPFWPQLFLVDGKRALDPEELARLDSRMRQVFR